MMWLPGLTAFMVWFSRWPRELEADLRRFYGLDLGGLYRGELTWRRVFALAGALPTESAFRSAVGDMPQMSIGEYRLVELVEVQTGEPHAMRKHYKGREKALERAERDDAIERQRAAARARNAAALERQRNFNLNN